MKILIEMGQSAAYHYRLGWANAFASAGNNVNYWNTFQKSAFDVFTEFEPDIFIGTTWGLNRAIIKCIAARPELKVLLSAPNWGDADEGIDKQDTVQFATESEKTFVQLLKELTGKPNYVMTYYHNNWVGETHNCWIDLGITPVGIPMAADIILYPLGTIQNSLKSDIAFVGNYWKYKGINLDKYLIKYCRPNSKLNIKIFGQNWPVYNCLGEINNSSLSMVKDIFRSAKICPAIYEPLSAKYGFDVSERVFKVCSSGGFCISEPVQSLFEDFDIEGVSPFYDKLEDNGPTYENAVAFYTNPKNEESRQKELQKSIHWVYKNHTYWHRTAAMLELLGLPEDADKLSKIAKDYYNEQINNNI